MCSFSVRAWAHYALVAFLFGAFSGMTFGNGQLPSIPDSAYRDKAKEEPFKAVVLLLGEQSDGWYAAGTGFFTTPYDIMTVGHVPRTSFLSMKALVTDDAYHSVLQTIPITGVDIYPGRTGVGRGPDIAHLRTSVAFTGTPLTPLFERPAIGTEFVSVGFGMVSVVNSYRINPFDGYKRAYANRIDAYGDIDADTHFAIAALDSVASGRATGLEGGGQDVDSGSLAAVLVNNQYMAWGLSSFNNPHTYALHGQDTGYETLEGYQSWYTSVVVPEPSSCLLALPLAILAAVKRRR